MKRCAGEELARGDGIQCIDVPDLTGMARRCYILRSWLHWNNYCEHKISERLLPVPISVPSSLRYYLIYGFS